MSKDRNVFIRWGALAASLTAITVFLGATFGWTWPPFPLRQEVSEKFDGVKVEFEHVDQKFLLAADARRKNLLETLRGKAKFQQTILDQTYGTIDAYEAKSKIPPTRVRNRAVEQQRELNATRARIQILERQ